MGLLDTLLGRDSSTATGPVPQPPQVYPTAVPYLDGTTALGLSALHRGVTLIADAIADMPWQEWRGEAPGVPVASSRLVRRPCATMTRREWTWRVVATEALYSTVYLLHVGGYDSEGIPWSLLPIPPGAITPAAIMDPWGILPASRYMVGTTEVGIEDLTIIRRAPFAGVPDHMAGLIRLARREFQTYLAADTHAARYWQNGGPTTTVITTDQELEPSDAATIAQRWVERRALGADYPAVLGKGAKAEPFGADPTTQSAVEARREMVADVGRYLGVPTRILNAPAGDSETYSNVEGDATDLLRYTLRGYAGPIEDAISEHLPGDPLVGRRMVIDATAFTAGSLLDRANAWGALVTSGIADPDEARTRGGFGLGPRGLDTAPATVTIDAVPAAIAAALGGTDGTA